MSPSEAVAKLVPALHVQDGKAYTMTSEDGLFDTCRRCALHDSVKLCTRENGALGCVKHAKVLSLNYISAFYVAV